MDKTKVSDKYQVVIPKSVRNSINLKRGQILQVLEVDNGILLTPEKKWPDDYIGMDKDIWSRVNVIDYLRTERDSWDRKSSKN